MPQFPQMIRRNINSSLTWETMRVSVEMKGLTWTPAQSRALHKGECQPPSSTYPSFLLEGALSLQPLIFGGLHVYKLSFFLTLEGILPSWTLTVALHLFQTDQLFLFLPGRLLGSVPPLSPQSLLLRFKNSMKVAHGNAFLSKAAFPLDRVHHVHVIFTD